MKKMLITVTALLGLGIGLIGCDVTDSVKDDDFVVINISPIPDIPGVSNQDVKGEIKSNVEITGITYTVKNIAGITDTTLSVRKKNIPAGQKKLDLTNDLAVSIQVSTTTCIGTYIFQISASASTATATISDTFTVSGTKDCSAPISTPINIATIIAGSHLNTILGCSIDLDAGVAYIAAQAATRVADIDLCYSTTGIGEDKLGSPFWAKTGRYNYAKLWHNPHRTKFYKTTLTKAEFNAITTKEQIPAFNFSKVTASSYKVKENEVYQVLTTEGANVLVLINDKVDGRAGAITIKTVSTYGDTTEKSVPDTFTTTPECADPEEGELIRINYPEGGEEFKPGNKIDIRYSIDVEQAPGALAFISKDRGRTWDIIVKSEMIQNTKTEGYECITYTWTIPSDFVTESNSNIKVKVSKYGDAVEYSVSDAFTITP